jgi:hypothetical protein
LYGLDKPSGTLTRQLNIYTQNIPDPLLHRAVIVPHISLHFRQLGIHQIAIPEPLQNMERSALLAIQEAQP